MCCVCKLQAIVTNITATYNVMYELAREAFVWVVGYFVLMFKWSRG